MRSAKPARPGPVNLRRSRDFLAENPALTAAVLDSAPWLPSALGELSRGMPNTTVMPFAEKPFFRPPGSYRCVYYCRSVFSEGAPGPHPVIAIKGLEPSIPDFEKILQDFHRACYSPHNIAEHLVFEEGKLPGCLGFREAVREAERASAIQTAHFEVYGSLARLPVPLGVFQHSDETCAFVAEAFRRHLSVAAFEAVTPALDSGLGVYLYYYPSVPTRARDVEFLLEGMDFRARVLALAVRVCDPDDVIGSWVRTFVRMLYLGFLPGALSSYRSGICCQPQNVCMDGGFVDLESLTALEELRDDTAIYAALQFSSESLIRSVRTLVAGSSDPARAEGLDIRVDLHYISQYVTALIQEAIRTESRPGLSLDRRIRQYFTPPATVAALVDRLSTYYSPKTVFDAPAKAFGPFGLSLLKSARGAQCL